MREGGIPGLWLGKRWTTDEHLVSIASGKVVCARDVRPFPPDQSFDLEYFKNVVGTPGNPSVVESEDVLHENPRAPIAKTDEPTGPPMARRVILQKSYFERFGYSANCPKCRAMLRGEEDCHGHTANCRKRIEEAMATDSISKQRLDAAQ